MFQTCEFGTLGFSRNSGPPAGYFYFGAGRIWDLFRISDFGFSIYFICHCLIHLDLDNFSFGIHLLLSMLASIPKAAKVTTIDEPP
jgi:hypothetical protein